MSDLRGKRQAAVRAILGPWPVRPLLLTVLYGFMNQFAAVRVAEAGQVPILPAYLHALPSTLAQSAAILLAASMARVLQRRLDPTLTRRGVYATCLLLTAVVLSVLRLVTVAQFTQQAGIIALRDFAALCIATSLFGISGERLAAQVRRTQEALDLAGVQREQILIADETAREEVARYLHDNVQADLIVLALQLRAQASALPELEGRRLSSAIDELDKVRLLDIRTASRRLNPDVESMGLSAALRELAAGYAPAMRISVRCPHALPGVTSQRMLALYRITEQAVLNAASHGRASECSVEVDPGEHAEITLRITNDGAAVSVDAVPGTGSAIIDAWVRRFHGKWSLGELDHRTALVAHLP